VFTVPGSIITIRVDVEKLQKAVAAEFAAKKGRRKAKAKSQPVAE
jgi:hypothetical protein